jgi:hypothetical protein
MHLYDLIILFRKSEKPILVMQVLMIQFPDQENPRTVGAIFPPPAEF